MKKLLFFDIDGTLAIPGSAPSPVTVSAVRKARSNGHKVFLSTGRTQRSVPQPVMEIGCDGGIFCAGGYTMVDGAILSQRTIPDSTKNTILKNLDTGMSFYILETIDCKFVSENAAHILSHLRLTDDDNPMASLAKSVFWGEEMREITEYQDEPICKITFFSMDFSFADRLCESLNGIAKVVRFDDLVPGFPLQAGEISDPSIHKGLAMYDICDYYAVSSEQCIAFGDSMNDIEMLQAAGVGIAMGNADARVQELADLICDSCEHDGVAKSLKMLGLI